MTTIFVFGSNLQGIHGAGAAKTAFAEYGAKWRMGFGPAGRSFAIPTKDWEIEPLGLGDIYVYIRAFKQYAELRQELVFLVTRIGCGLAGYTDQQIAPMFVGTPKNCIMPEQWQPWIGKNYDLHNEGVIL